MTDFKAYSADFYGSSSLGQRGAIEVIRAIGNKPREAHAVMGDNAPEVRKENINAITLGRRLSKLSRLSQEDIMFVRLVYGNPESEHMEINLNVDPCMTVDEAYKDDPTMLDYFVKLDASSHQEVASVVYRDLKEGVPSAELFQYCIIVAAFLKTLGEGSRFEVATPDSAVGRPVKTLDHFLKSLESYAREDAGVRNFQAWQR
ncbi:MAG: hypothetical protein KJ709_08085 [Nanoarchaeota archaeon]|nr:hypothetical protein [Nanoarchaeota archaeon]